MIYTHVLKVAGGVPSPLDVLITHRAAHGTANRSMRCRCGYSFDSWWRLSVQQQRLLMHERRPPQPPARRVTTDGRFRACPAPHFVNENRSSAGAKREEISAEAILPATGSAVALTVVARSGRSTQLARADARHHAGLETYKWRTACCHPDRAHRPGTSRPACLRAGWRGSSMDTPP